MIKVKYGKTAVAQLGNVIQKKMSQEDFPNPRPPKGEAASLGG